jgi:hypothetical protein
MLSGNSSREVRLNFKLERAPQSVGDGSVCLCDAELERFSPFAPLSSKNCARPHRAMDCRTPRAASTASFRRGYGPSQYTRHPVPRSRTTTLTACKELVVPTSTSNPALTAMTDIPHKFVRFETTVMTASEVIHLSFLSAGWPSIAVAQCVPGASPFCEPMRLSGRSNTRGNETRPETERTWWRKLPGSAMEYSGIRRCHSSSATRSSIRAR